MIYRLRNKDTKALATAEELPYLRVNSEGVVERLGFVNVNETFLGGNPITIYDSVMSFWQPAPEWVVEWGIKHGIVNVFVNDVLKIWEWKCDEEPELNDFHFVKVVWSNEYYMPLIYDKALEYEEAPLSYALETYVNADNFVDPYFEVVGNIHDNPELLEDK